MKFLILQEFKRNFKSLILWTLIISASGLMMVAMYPVFKDSFANIQTMLETYPQGFLEAFGLTEGGLDITSPYGWYGMEGYLFVILLGASYAAILGSSILSKEEDDKTIEFLLTKPISRNDILFGKLIVVLLNLVFQNIVMGIMLCISFLILGNFELTTTMLFILGPFILQLVFASVAFFISIFITKSRTVMSISLALSIGLYAIDLISALTERFEFLKYITPYEYVNAVSIAKDGEIRPLYLLISMIIILTSLVSSVIIYNKKDITV